MRNVLDYTVTNALPKLTMLDGILTASGSTLALDGGEFMTGLDINRANITGANIAGNSDTSTTICDLPISAYVSTTNNVISLIYVTTPTIAGYECVNNRVTIGSIKNVKDSSTTRQNSLNDYSYNGNALGADNFGFGTINTSGNIAVKMTIIYAYKYAAGTTSAGTSYSTATSAQTKVLYMPYSALLNNYVYTPTSLYCDITPPSNGTVIGVASISFDTISITKDYQLISATEKTISLDGALINGIRFGTDSKKAAIRVNELTADSVSNTSDRRLKTGIEYALSGYDALFDGLKPASFRFKNNRAKTRFGFVAQDVESAMSAAGLNPTDFGMVSKNFIDGKSVYALNYTDLHALEIYEIQKLKKEVEELKARLGEK